MSALSPEARAPTNSVDARESRPADISGALVSTDVPSVSSAASRTTPRTSERLGAAVIDSVPRVTRGVATSCWDCHVYPEGRPLATLLCGCALAFRNTQHTPTGTRSASHVSKHAQSRIVGSSQLCTCCPTSRPLCASTRIFPAHAPCRGLWHPGSGLRLVSTSSACYHSWPERCECKAPKVVHRRTGTCNREKAAASASTSRHLTLPRTATLACAVTYDQSAEHAL